MCTGKSSYTKSSPKFGKTSPTSSVLSSNGKGMTKVELKERAHDKTNGAALKNVAKAPTKENKKPLEFKLHSGERAVKRAMFNYSVATNYYIMKQQKKTRREIAKDDRRGRDSYVEEGNGSKSSIDAFLRPTFSPTEIKQAIDDAKGTKLWKRKQHLLDLCFQQPTLSLPF